MVALKIVLYLLGGLLTAPGMLLAFFFWNVDQATKQKGLLELLWFAFVRFLEMFQWLFIIVIPVVVVWLVLAFLPKYRVIGESGVALAGVVSIVLMFVLAGPPKLDALFIPIVSLTGIALNVWLIWWEVTPRGSIN